MFFGPSPSYISPWLHVCFVPQLNQLLRLGFTIVAIVAQLLDCSLYWYSFRVPWCWCFASPSAAFVNSIFLCLPPPAKTKFQYSIVSKEIPGTLQNGTPIPIHLPYHFLKIPWSMGNGMGPAYRARGPWSPQFHGPMRLRGYFQPWILGFWPASSWPLLSPEDPYFMQAAGSLNSPGTFLVKSPNYDREWWRILNMVEGVLAKMNICVMPWRSRSPIIMTSYVLPLRVDDTSLAYLYC